MAYNGMDLSDLSKAHDRAGHHMGCVMDMHDYEQEHTTSGLWYRCKRCRKEKPRT